MQGPAAGQGHKPVPSEVVVKFPCPSWIQRRRGIVRALLLELYGLYRDILESAMTHDASWEVASDHSTGIITVTRRFYTTSTETR